MSRLFLVLSFLLTATQAFAMDDAERARQMEAYNAQMGASVSADDASAASQAQVTATPASVTTTSTTTLDTFAPNRKSQKEREMEAYQAYVASQGNPQATGEAMQAATTVMVPAGNVTTTVEKTTATNYTVSKRKVGLVGNRPYPATTEEMAGGATMQTIVNGVETENKVIAPDPVAELKNEKASGDYYSGKPEAEVYVSADSNVRVHDTGSFNN